MHVLLFLCTKYLKVVSVNSGRGYVVYIHYLNHSCVKAVRMVTWYEFRIFFIFALLIFCWIMLFIVGSVVTLTSCWYLERHMSTLGYNHD